MTAYKVRLLTEAMTDLEEIILYIASDSPKAANKFHDTVMEKLNGLALFPKRAPLVPDKKMSIAGFRMLGIKPYIAFYRILGQDVFVYRILHGATNYPLLYENMAKSQAENQE